FDIAEDGERALDALHQGEYDIVLMDCQMPRLDGYEATRRWRVEEADRGASRTPIVAVTAHAFEDERERVAECGMDDFLSKPVQFEALNAVLAKWTLHQARTLQAAERRAPKDERPLLQSDMVRSSKLEQLFIQHARL